MKTILYKESFNEESLIPKSPSFMSFTTFPKGSYSPFCSSFMLLLIFAYILKSLIGKTIKCFKQKCFFGDWHAVQLLRYHLGCPHPIWEYLSLSPSSTSEPASC